MPMPKGGGDGVFPQVPAATPSIAGLSGKLLACDLLYGGFAGRDRFREQWLQADTEIDLALRTSF